MFVGTINQEIRSIIAEAAQDWKGKPVYVGCSGNLTVERLLASVGFSEVHGNDVSLYSCALGAYAAGTPIKVRVKSPVYEWLEPYMGEGLPTLATLLLCTTYLDYAERSLPYFARMARAYRNQWAQLHAATVTKLEKVLAKTKLASFTAGDVFDYLGTIPENAPFVTFPPTYAKGYERLYKRIDATFDWDAPSYEVFTEQSFGYLLETIKARPYWVVIRDRPEELLDGYCIGLVQPTLASKPVYVYASNGNKRVSYPHIKTEPVNLPRATGEISGKIDLVPISGGQLNLLRAEYLAKGIKPADGVANYAVTVGGQMIGAICFGLPSWGKVPTDAYMMADFAIRPSPYRRLSKLVLAVAMAKETRTVLEQVYGRRVDTITTTCFTENSVSMKYRGLFNMVARKEGKIEYDAPAGRWTFAEAFDWWKAKHGQQLKG